MYEPLGCDDRWSVLILGRELGLELEEADVTLEPVLEVSNVAKNI